MKKIFATLTIVALFAGVSMTTPCGGASGSNGPSNLMMKMWGEFKAGNYEKGMQFWVDNSQKSDKATNKDEKEIVAAFSEKAKETFDKKQGVKDVELLSEVISEDGQTAKVEIKVTFGDGTTDENTGDFVLADGRWWFSNTK